jgi:ubiquinone/menaquinone biosynthesis C-methylase UbiE
VAPLPDQHDVLERQPSRAIRGGPMPSADEIRDAQREIWARCSTGWDTWADAIELQMAPVGAEIIAALEITEDQQHLDVAAGTGQPGLSIARLAPRGRVVVTDLAPEMVAVAARRAAESGLGNVETRACSADALPFGDGEFDSVSVRFGFMFFPDLSGATAELARVLRPGGRISASVWADPDANPWTGIVRRAIEDEMPLPPAEEGSPSMYRCAAPGFISDLYAAAGLRDAREQDVDVELVAASPEEFWDTVSGHVSFAVMALDQLDAGARERVRAAVVAQVAPYEVDGMVRVPGRARCISATR